MSAGPETEPILRSLGLIAPRPLFSRNIGRPGADMAASTSPGLLAVLSLLLKYASAGRAAHGSYPRPPAATRGDVVGEKRARMKGAPLRDRGSMSARTYGWRPFVAVAVASLLLPVLSPAQIVVSVRAGLLNHTSGCVLLDEKHIEPGRLRLTHLIPGQRLRTEDGYAEVMLGPEVFLRLGFGSELEMVSTDLEAPQVLLLNGSALIDANGLTARKPVSVLVADSEVRLVRKGLYRVNIPNQGPETATVWDGRAVVIAGSGEKTLFERHTVELAADGKSLAPRRVERSQNDPLDDWSSERATAIAHINGEMLRRQVDDDRDKSFGLPRLGRGLPGP